MAEPILTKRPWEAEMTKEEMRQHIREIEKGMTMEEREQSDQALRLNLFHLPEFKHATRVLLFSSFGTEPNTSEILRWAMAEGKTVALPRMSGEGTMEARKYDPHIPLIPGKYGILEPGMNHEILSKDNLDLILVPAVCYDRKCGRLGHGAGYYDRYLADFHGMTIGLCREVLLQDEVPLAPHDIRVNIVITEHETFRRT